MKIWWKKYSNKQQEREIERKPDWECEICVCLFSSLKCSLNEVKLLTLREHTLLFTTYIYFSLSLSLGTFQKHISIRDSKNAPGTMHIVAFSLLCVTLAWSVCCPYGIGRIYKSECTCVLLSFSLSVCVSCCLVVAHNEFKRKQNNWEKVNWILFQKSISISNAKAKEQSVKVW